jgi:hypothetical protein
MEHMYDCIICNRVFFRALLPVTLICISTTGLHATVKAVRDA